MSQQGDHLFEILNVELILAQTLLFSYSAVWVETVLIYYKYNLPWGTQNFPFVPLRTFLKFGKRKKSRKPRRKLVDFYLNCKSYAKMYLSPSTQPVTVNAKNKILLREGSFPAFSSEFLPRLIPDDVRCDGRKHRGKYIRTKSPSYIEETRKNLSTWRLGRGRWRILVNFEI